MRPMLWREVERYLAWSGAATAGHGVRFTRIDRAASGPKRAFNCAGVLPSVSSY
jgi:hypothetical protein